MLDNAIKMSDNLMLPKRNKPAYVELGNPKVLDGILESVDVFDLKTIANNQGVFKELDWGKVERAVEKYELKVVELSESVKFFEFKKKLNNIIQQNLNVPAQQEDS